MAVYVRLPIMKPINKVWSEACSMHVNRAQRVTGAAVSSILLRLLSCGNRSAG